ncbi:MAG: 4'-phosphopantetheinyl transferase superfamily protein [Cyanobacteriota bacterium]|nr:4'-phosphopantetheinyl transferase superfamily protein [Cyanobacteriota bacterium]
MPPWLSPPSPAILRADEVHIWRLGLDLPATQLQRLYSTLCGDERERAQRFYFDRDRNAYIAARGGLRAILGQYIHRHPAEITFSYSSKGKPGLIQETNSSQIEFNVSHSHNLALYGIVRDRRIGIDVEFLRPLPNASQLARRFFSARECTSIASFPPDLQPKVFFSGWTRKEAYLKATGVGLGGLQDVEVSLEFDREPVLLNVSQSDSCQDWTLYHLAPDSGYIGALAVETQRQELQLRYFDIS